MAHFAEIDDNNVVVRVIVVHNNELLDDVGNESEEKGIAFCKTLFPENQNNWIQTSYNGNFRKNFASIGFTYDPIRDAFIPFKPYPSWILEESTCKWKAPVEYPSDGLGYEWDEKTLTWKRGIFV